MKRLITAALILALSTTFLSAQHYDEIEDWETVAGSLNVEDSESILYYGIDKEEVFVGESGGQKEPWSYGWYAPFKVFSAYFDLAVNMYIMSDDKKSTFELYIPGAAVGFTSYEKGYYFIYESEEHWTGWKHSAEIKTDSPNNIRIRQNGALIELYINGKFVDEFELKNTPEAKRVGIYHKSMPGKKSSVAFWGFKIREAQ